MKKRRLFLIFSIFFVFFAIFSLSSPLFRLNDVEIIFYNISGKITNIENNTYYNSTSKINEITSLVKDNYGQLMFFLDKDKIKQDIESNFSRIKVIDIQSIFSRKILVNLQERHDLLYIKGENNYYILDMDYKIVDITNILNPDLISIEFESDFGKISFFDFFEIVEQAFSLGTFLSDNNYVFTALLPMFYVLDDSIPYIINSLSLYKDSQNTVTLSIFGQNAVTISIQDVLYRFEYKLNKIVSALSTLQNREPIKTTYGNLLIDKSCNVYWSY